MPANTMPSAAHDVAVAKTTAEENRLKAFELYKAGATYSAIAIELGVSRTSVRNYVHRVLDRLANESKALAERYRNLHLARLQDATFAIWPAVKRGDSNAILSLLRIMEREARLLGLDAPQKIDIEQRIRLIAEREGLDPDEAVREAYRVLRETREEA